LFLAYALRDRLSDALARVHEAHFVLSSVMPRRETLTQIFKKRHRRAQVNHSSGEKKKKKEEGDWDARS
jgi:heme exporter protein D